MVYKTESNYLVNKDVHSLHDLSGKGYLFFLGICEDFMIATMSTKIHDF